MRQRSIPLSEVVPDLEPVSNISRVIVCPVNHGQVSSPSKDDAANAWAV